MRVTPALAAGERAPGDDGEPGARCALAGRGAVGGRPAGGQRARPGPSHQEGGRRQEGPPPSQGNAAGCHLGGKRKFFNSLVDLSESKIKYQVERLSK